jgi:hypothetical protein
MDENLSASDQLRCLEEGQSYRETHPKSTLSDALQESRQRWPEAHENLYRAFFLTGWSYKAHKGVRFKSNLCL